MITSKFYPTNQTVAETNIELTKIVSEIDSPLPNIAEPYYMGYVRYENFPKQFNLNQVIVEEGGSSITFSPVEENHSWGYIKQAGAGSDFRGTPQLYAYKSDDSIYEYNTNSNAHCRFINQIKMANVNTVNNFQIEIHGIIIKNTYLEEIQTANGSFAFYHNNNPDATGFRKIVNFSISDFIEIQNNREKFSFTVNWNSVDYTIEFNGEDYISDTVAKISLAGGLTAYLSIINFSFDGRADYYTSLGVGTTMTITPFFSQTIPEDHEATGIIAQENAVWVPHNTQIGDSRFRYNYYVSTFSNIGAPGAVAGMIPGNFPLGTLTIDEFEAAGFSANYDGMINETMFLSGTGSVDWGDEHYYGYRYYSQISIEDIRREISVYNKIYDTATDPIATYTDEFLTFFFSDTDEPTRNALHGNYPQDESFSDRLRPWQIPGQVITVNEYDPADIPPFDPEEGGDDPTAAPNSGVSGDGFPANTVITLPSQQLINYGAFDTTSLNSLESNLWNKPDSFFEGLAAAQKVNPLDYFISLRYYPISFTENDGEQRTKLFLGRGGEIGSPSMEYRLLNKASITYNFGTIDIKTHYKNFLDYAPYTKVYISLPFCGQIELNSTIIMGKKVGLHATIDLTDGSVLWEVDIVEGETSYPILSKQGKIGADIPITGLNASQMGANIANASLRIAGHLLNAPGQVLGGAAQTAEGLYTGDIMSVGSGLKTLGGLALQALGDAYSMGMASKEIVEKMGPSTGYASLKHYINKTPFIIYQRPIQKNPSSYGHTVGYLVNKEAKIEDMSGFTVCKNPDLSSIGQATDREKTEIKAFLESGFYA